MNNSKKEQILNYALKEGIITNEVIACIEDTMRKEEYERFLKRHPYAIWYSESDKLYKTHLPKDDGSRMLRKRKTKEEINDVVVEFWRDKDENPRVEEVFANWLTQKLEWGEISRATSNRYERCFQQCFDILDFKNRKVKSISEEEIEDFLKSAIYQQQLSAKGFSNLRTLIYGIFKYCKKKGYVEFSITQVINDIEISRKAFKKIRKADNELVFMEEELTKVLNYLEENLDMKNAVLLLLFKTGLRPGEVVALEKRHIKGNVISVRNTEIHYRDELGNNVYEVRPFPKTDAGNRDVIVADSDLWILEKVLKMNYSEPYLFMQNGKRLLEYQVSQRLKTVCKHTGVVRKSPNKIRKTYASMLKSASLDDTLIIEQLGHTHIGTTQNHYICNRKDMEQKIKVINEKVHIR